MSRSGKKSETPGSPFPDYVGLKDRDGEREVGKTIQVGKIRRKDTDLVTVQDTTHMSGSSGLVVSGLNVFDS